MAITTSSSTIVKPLRRGPHPRRRSASSRRVLRMSANFTAENRQCVSEDRISQRRTGFQPDSPTLPEIDSRFD